MESRMPTSQRPMRCRPRQRGFSFTEILFAVMILGIGFIMVAAMFPVAIHQTEATNQETIAASVGRAGPEYLSQLAGVQIVVPNAPSPPLASPLTASALLPTVPPAAFPATLTIPAGKTSVTFPGAVWSFNDVRDTYQVTEGATPSNHSDYLWRLISNNIIQPADPRFAWIAFYKRDLVAQGAPLATPVPAFAPYAQVIVIVAQARSKPAFAVGTNIDITRPGPKAYANLEPRQFIVSMALPPFPGAPSTVRFRNTIDASGGSTAYSANTTPVAENAFLVISDDNLPLNTPPANPLHGALDGRVYRIGSSTAAPGAAQSPIWQLEPGSDLSAGDQLILQAMLTAKPNLRFSVFIVGRGVDPNSASQFSGNAQDVSVYTTYVQVPN